MPRDQIPADWVPLSRFTEIFGRGALGRQRRRRFTLGAVQSGQVLEAREGGERFFDPVLEHDGRAIGEYAQTRPIRKAPAGIARQPEQVRRDHELDRELHDRVARLPRRASLHDPKVLKQFLAANADLFEKFSKAPRTAERILARARRYAQGAAPACRGRPRGTKTAEIPEKYADFILHQMVTGPTAQNKRALARVIRDARDLAARDGVTLPGDSTVRAWYERTVPRPAKVLGRDGPSAYRAYAEPKIERPREGVEAGRFVTMDGRRCDILRRCYRPGKGWVATRPIVVTVADRATGFIVGYAAGLAETGELTRAALSMALEQNGAWDELLTDNGRAFKSSLGVTGARAGALAENANHMARIIGFRVRLAQARSGWTKESETWFRQDAALDREDPFCIGNEPGARPEKAYAHAQKRLDQMPTLGHFATVELPRRIEVINNTPSQGRGNMGLCPAVVFEQRRTAIRRIDPDVIELACSAEVGPVRPRRNGGIPVRTRLGTIVYGESQEECYRLPDRPVFVFRRMDDLSQVIVATEDKEPLFIATNERLRGATEQDLRESMRLKARVRRSTRNWMREHEFRLFDPQQQVIHIRAEARRAEAAEQRKQLAPPPEPEVTIAQPALTAAMKRVKAKAARKEAAKRAAQLKTGTDDTVRLAWELLSTPDPRVEAEREALHNRRDPGDLLVDLMCGERGQDVGALWAEYGRASGPQEPDAESPEQKLRDTWGQLTPVQKLAVKGELDARQERERESAEHEQQGRRRAKLCGEQPADDEGGFADAT